MTDAALFSHLLDLSVEMVNDIEGSARQDKSIFHKEGRGALKVEFFDCLRGQLRFLAGKHTQWSSADEIYARILSAEQQRHVSANDAAEVLKKDLLSPTKTYNFVPAAFYHALDSGKTGNAMDFLKLWLPVVALASKEMFIANRPDAHITAVKEGIFANVESKYKEVFPGNSSYREIDIEEIKVQIYQRTNLDSIYRDYERDFRKTKDSWGDVEKASRKPKQESVSALEEINDLVGYATLKKWANDIARSREVEAFEHAWCGGDRQQDDNALPFTGSYYHIAAILGAGMGKSSIFTNLIGRFLKEQGILEKGHTVRVTAADLMPGFVRQSGPMTKKKCEEALDGVLVIDEGEALRPSVGNDFAGEVLAELTDKMDAYRDRLVVVLLGGEKLKDIVEGHLGLARRLALTINDKSYSIEDLMLIRDKQLSLRGLVMDDDAKDMFEQLTAKDKMQTSEFNWGNGGYIRDFIENVDRSRKVRLHTDAGFRRLREKFDRVNRVGLKNAEREEIGNMLTRLTLEDVLSAQRPLPDFVKGENEKRSIGFAITPAHKKAANDDEADTPPAQKKSDIAAEVRANDMPSPPSP